MVKKSLKTIATQIQKRLIMIIVIYKFAYRLRNNLRLFFFSRKLCYMFYFIFCVFAIGSNSKIVLSIFCINSLLFSVLYVTPLTEK